jgi:hypothetical protein
MNECVAVVEYGITHENAIGVIAFMVIVAVAYLARRIKDHPKVTPAYKVGDKKHG